MNKPFAPVDTKSQPRDFTAEEFLRMTALGAFDDMKVELVDGRIARLNSAHSRHGLVLGQTIACLAELYGRKRLAVDTLLRLSEQTVRAFDVAVIHADAEPGAVLEPADVLLGVEIADTSLQRDLGDKQSTYAAAGVATYLVVDIEAEVTHFMTGPTASGSYERRAVVRFEEALQLPDADQPLILA